MKFKHLLLYALCSLIIVSCQKGGSGDNFTFTPPIVTVADTSGTGTNTPPATIVVGADAQPANGDNSNLLFGNPSAAATDIVVNKDNYLINQGYYVESYNSTKAEPNWVSWHLDASNITSAAGRQNSFAPYGGLPSAFYQVQSTSFSGSGFDRGHNCPSGDRTSSISANDATFLMTNMIPQAPKNNQGTWGNFEGYLRTLVTQGNEVYIIMGNYGSGGVGSVSTAVVTSINNAKVNVPSNVWKVAVVLPVGNGDLARVTAATRVITIDTPNIQAINADWKQYITTMASVEKATGLNLLSLLSPTIHDAIKVKVDPGS